MLSTTAIIFSSLTLSLFASNTPIYSSFSENDVGKIMSIALEPSKSELKIFAIVVLGKRMSDEMLNSTVNWSYCEEVK